MKIRINTDNNITIQKNFTMQLNAVLNAELRSFSDRITHLEVYLADEDSSTKSIHYKRCLMEARLAGRQPVVVTGLANTEQQAINQAFNKLKTFLDAILERKTTFLPQPGSIATAYKR